VQKTYNILIAGVGGQGNLVCGRVLADAAVSAGYRPVIGETFGASRRGGTVFTHVRVGIDDVGPLIPAHSASLIVGLEPVESLRAAIEYGGTGTVVVLNVRPVQTLASLSGKTKYPQINEILEALSGLGLTAYPVDAAIVLQDVESQRVLNSFMLGAASALKKMPMDVVQIRESVAKFMAHKDANLTAFSAGLSTIEQVLQTNRGSSAS